MTTASPPAERVRLLQIRITRTRRLRFDVRPPTAEVGYTHDTDHVFPGSPKIRHRIVCEVTGLLPGQSLEVQLDHLRKPFENPAVNEALLHAFPSAGPIPHGFGWVLTPDANTFDTGRAWSSVGHVGAFRIKYNVRLYEHGDLVGGVDPDVNLTPDP